MDTRKKLSEVGRLPRLPRRAQEPAPVARIPGAKSNFVEPPFAVPIHQDNELENWVLRWANANNSAVEMWGDETIWSKLKKLVDSGAEVHSISWDEDDRGVQGRLRQYELAGWKVLAKEDNMSSAEMLLYKPQ